MSSNAIVVSILKVHCKINIHFKSFKGRKIFLEVSSLTSMSSRSSIWKSSTASWSYSVLDLFHCRSDTRNHLAGYSTFLICNQIKYTVKLSLQSFDRLLEIQNIGIYTFIKHDIWYPLDLLFILKFIVDKIHRKFSTNKTFPNLQKKYVQKYLNN